MQQTEFYLLECYLMAACRDMKAIINNGKLEGFTKEDEEWIKTNRLTNRWNPSLKR